MIKLFQCLFILQPLLLLSQNQSEYPDVIIDSYNSTTKTKNIFYQSKKQ